MSMSFDKKMIDVYDELRTDLQMYITPGQAQQVVSWLDQAGLIDYDGLKDYYLEEDDEDIAD